jgi:kumamolisin
VKLPLRPIAGLLAAPLSIAIAAFPAQAAPAATAPVTLRADTVAALSHATRVADVAATRQVTVTVSLKQRDTAGLDAFLAQVSDAHSPLYQHYLTVTQFAQRYGATPAAVAQVSSYLTGHGLKVQDVTANRLSLTATGTAAQVERAFGTQLATYHDRTTGREFFANATAPVLPAGVAAVVSDVSGLSDYGRLTHFSEKQQAAPHASSGLTPTTAKSAYNLTKTESSGYNGSGQTVALLEFSAYAASDVKAYDSHYGLKVATPTVVNAGGGTTDTSGQDEVDLDIEVVQALAPGATIKVYEAPNSDAGETAIYAKLVSDDVPIISISWGTYEAGETNRTAVDADLKEAAAQGQSVYAASGDSGSDDAGNGGTSVDFPASDTYTTGTGGTSLTLSSSGAWSKETAWSGSGGGVSSYFATPSFQSKVNTGSKRAVPDVAADADPNSGWSVYTGGAWAEYGGTSAAAPNWAAFTAVFDNYAAKKGGSKIGYANATLYNLAQSSKYGSAFHDVKSGSNGAYSAGTGYDKVTGWGSYNGGGFITAIG